MTDTTPANTAKHTVSQRILSYVYVPFMVSGVDGAAIALSAAGVAEVWLLPLLVIAVVASFLAERVIPYERSWNTDHDDTRRDRIHAAVNETMILAGVAVIPLLASVVPAPDLWPRHWPFLAQVLVAILVADFGITTTHLASHKLGVLWRFHAVHHSVTRFYGLNGLMKHPLHQAIETAAGVAPLILVGLPVSVAGVLALAVAVQLLLQHSNADYRVGPATYVLALNAGHRFHHLRWAGVGDVNFGLFTLIWDHLYRTYFYDPARRFSSAELGMAAKPHYPTAYSAQLRHPFTPDGGC
nr:sterol desaturase family protein [Nocardia mikamii]